MLAASNTRTYGTVRFIPGKKLWEIEAEPHVIMRIKRTFGKIDTRQHGVVTLSATPENSRDLEWFLDRYPMKVEDAAVLQALSSQHKEAETILHRLLSGMEIPESFDLLLPPRDYQSFAANVWRTSKGLLLGDDVGVGKTVSAICGLSRGDMLPSLVTTLTHLPRQWEAEIKRFTGLNVHILTKGTPYDIVKKSGGRFPDVIISNYHKLSGWAETLAPIMRSLIFDECQELRRPESNKYAAARHLAEKAAFRIGLSIGPHSRLVLKGGPFGRGWVGSIETAFQMVQGVRNVQTQYGVDLLDVEGVGITARGWEEHFGFCWKPVKTFIRHLCDKTTSRVVVKGREIVLTHDHSIYKESAEGITSLQTSELTISDVLPLDNGRAWNCESESSISVFDVLKDSCRVQVLVDHSSLTRKELGLTPQQYQKVKLIHSRGARLNLSTFKRVRDKLPEPAGVYYAGRGDASYFGTGEIWVSSWAYLAGFYLGDGWFERNASGDVVSVAFSVDAKTIPKFLKEVRRVANTPLRVKVRKSTNEMQEIRCTNAIFARMLAHALGGSRRCWDKRIPTEWITTWDEKARRQLLHGLLDSDGGVAEGECRYSTTSNKLAHDVMLLASSLGLNAGVHKRKAELGGLVTDKCGIKRQVIGRRPSYQVFWSEPSNGHRGMATQYKPHPLYNRAPVQKIAANISPKFVFDLEMEGHPSFVAEGILVHNSATPIYGYGAEIFYILDVLAPGVLGTFDEFVREWCVYVDGKCQIQDPIGFGLYLREAGLMLRRTAIEVGRELPPITIVPHYIDADPKVLMKMKGRAIELAKLILAQGEQFRGQKMQARGEFDMRMRQQTGIAKAPFVAEFVKFLHEESKQKIVLYAWHREVYEVLLEKLKDLKPVLYTGSESANQKAASVKAFVEGDSQVIIISLRSGAGLDGLQHISRVVVFGELDWSPAVHEQCLGRVARDGQLHPVVAYYLLSEIGSDPVISDILGVKKGQLDGIRNPNNDIITKLQVQGDYIRKLAEEFLKENGIVPPQPITLESVTPEGVTELL